MRERNCALAKEKGKAVVTSACLSEPVLESSLQVHAMLVWLLDRRLIGGCAFQRREYLDLEGIWHDGVERSSWFTFTSL